MPDLSILTANAQVELALQTAILLGMAKRLTVADTAALAAIASPTISHDALAFTSATSQVWRFHRYSTATASAGVIVPDGSPTTGRWLLTSSTSSSGYLRAVKLYDGDPAEEKILEWLFGQVPSVIIVWDGDDYEPKSGGSPGALYRVPMRFSLWAISRNLRAEQQGITGPQLATEAAADPGVYRILGDLRRTLAGSDLNQPGVNYCELESASRVLSSAVANRGHVYKLAIKVLATIHNTAADDADNPARDLDAINAMWKWAQAKGSDGTTYPATYLDVGGEMESSTGLEATYAAGFYMVDGEPISFGGDTETLSPNKVTFRYVDDVGAISYIARDDDGTIPPTPTGRYLIGATTTNATDVVLDQLLGPYLLGSNLVDVIGYVPPPEE